MSENVYRYQHLIRQDCPLPPGTHVSAYMRDSGGEEQDRSVSQQIEAAQEYCLRHNLVLDYLYADDAKQSSNTEKRDQLQEMLSALRQQRKPIHDRYKREKVAHEKPYGAIFWKSNRLGRDSIEATYIKADLRLRGITVIDLVTSANTGNTAMDTLIEAFQQWQDEQLLDDISTNARRGLAQLVSLRDTDPDFLNYNPDWVGKSTGAYLGIFPGRLPTGFKGERIQIGVYSRKKGRSSGEKRIVQRLVPDPDLWDTCCRAWEMRQAGAPLDDIHHETGLFKNSNVYTTFFRNRIYTGTLFYGGVLYENFVPAMIPQGWFDRVQVDIAERGRRIKGEAVKPEHRPANVGSKYFLSGLVYCGEVDGEEHPMHIESYAAKKGVRGNYRFFICTTKKNSRNARCSARRMNIRTLERAVLDGLTQTVLTLDNLRPIADGYRTLLDERNRDAEARIGAVQDRLADVRQSISNVMDAIEKMGYASHLQERYDRRQREEAELLAELAQLKAIMQNKHQATKFTDAMLEAWIENIRDALAERTSDSARQVAQALIEKIVVKGREGTLYYTLPVVQECQEYSFYVVRPEGHALKTIHTHLFVIPDTLIQSHPDKQAVFARIIAMRQTGQSFAAIGREVGLTRQYVARTYWAKTKAR